jgi:quercetin dioxygenase-like cupin family protein
MKINADFSKTIFVDTTKQNWVASPMLGVERKPLDRVGAEVARATSIVRYAPKSTFSPHVHSGGEEFIVLEGVFQDEHADYPKGSYVRNPPQSMHKPGSEKGCVIFVKLWQFQPDDRQHVKVTMENSPITFSTHDESIIQRTLYQDEYEKVSHVSLAANTVWQSDCDQGNELLVLQGSVVFNHQIIGAECWLRLPIEQLLQVQAGESGAKLWLKTGNLPDLENQIKRLNNNRPY